MNQENKTKEVRKGFHPALTISTVAVIIFVLWFCPLALMNARIEQTENNAISIMEKKEFSEIDNSFTDSANFQKMQPTKKYTDYLFYSSKTTPAVVYAIPQYYGKTALNTLCYKDNTLYKKDIQNVKPAGFDFPEPDNTWIK